MNASFFLFDVNQGQCAALKLPNGKWCLFDAGRSPSFSPIEWIVNQSGIKHFYKVTISHPHGDHICDVKNLNKYCPSFLKSVSETEAYLDACRNTCSSADGKDILDQYVTFKGSFRRSFCTPNYDSIRIDELSLPLDVVMQDIGGSDNSKVNNASVVTRISVFGTSILLCGDMEKTGWEYALSETNPNLENWKRLVRNSTILIAPHHGHQSGYSTELMRLADPSIVLASVRSNDDDVDSRYSTEPRGLIIGDAVFPRKMISTRNDGNIRISIYSSPINGKTRSWCFF